MSLVDVDSWSTEYEACDRLYHNLLAQLAQRAQEQRLSPEYNRLTAAVQIGLKQFETELRQLKTKFDACATDGTITFEEIERRQRQVDVLQSQLQQLQTKYTNSTRSDRVSTNSESLWPSASSTTTRVEGIANPADIEALKRTHIDILEEQNRGLETLSQTIGRQRAQAARLGREVEDQNDIIDNLASTMERVGANVHTTTGNLSLINRRDSTWGYWLVIIILMVAIIIVALVLK